MGGCCIKGNTSPLTSPEDVLNNSRKYKNSSEPELVALADHFCHADLDGSGHLSAPDELEVVFRRFGIDCKRSRLQLILDELGIEDHLDFDDFVAVYRELEGRQIFNSLFRKYATSKEMSVQDFMTFWQSEQKDSFSSSVPNTFKPWQFTKILTGPANSWVSNHDCDLAHPIWHYFICSSHNTYLTGDQWRSKSDVEMYKQALLQGCKCVELDCWNGVNDEPVVYHGYTMTSKLLFRSVIETVAKYAFVTSPLPVILSLEVHCTLEQQVRMAYHLEEIFGVTLRKPIQGDNPLSDWTLEALQGRVLVKGKVLYGAEFDEEDDESGVRRKSGGTKAVKQVAPQLSELVWLIAVKCGLLDSRIGVAQGNECSSFAETTALELIKRDPEGVARLNKRCISRIYPKGLRVDSSNLDPCPFWAAGCQVVAINWQTRDRFWRTNRAFFASTNSCGYVLKPAHLRSEDLSGPIPHKLTLRLISGHHLPAPQNLRKADIVDPYVEVCLRDSGKVTRLCTRYIPDNGFNPAWNETLEFAVTSPGCSVITLRVMDYEPGFEPQLLGEVSANVAALRCGYRVALLETADELIAKAGHNSAASVLGSAGASGSVARAARTDRRTSATSTEMGETQSVQSGPPEPPKRLWPPHLILWINLRAEAGAAAVDMNEIFLDYSERTSVSVTNSSATREADDLGGSARRRSSETWSDGWTDVQTAPPAADHSGGYSRPGYDFEFT